LKFNTPFIRKVTHWFRQATTGIGMAGGFTTLSAVATGAIKWTQALAVLPGIIYLLAHPERIPAEMDQNTLNQLGQSLADVAGRVEH
jgi:hypothetical protein